MKSFPAIAAVICYAAALSACGGGNTAAVQPFSSSSAGVAPTSPVSAPLQSISAIVTKLEDEGQLPKLDRTDTLLGVDANGDGVRDDIKAWINKQDLSSPQKGALTQLALALSATLTADVANKSDLGRVYQLEAAAINCIYDRKAQILKSGDRTIKVLESYTFNTKSRTLAAFKFTAALDGYVSSSSTETSCVP